MYLGHGLDLSRSRDVTGHSHVFNCFFLNFNLNVFKIYEVLSFPVILGSTVYTCMLNKHGGVEADLTVSAIEPGPGTSVHDPAFQGIVTRAILQLVS